MALQAPGSSSESDGLLSLGLGVSRVRERLSIPPHPPHLGVNREAAGICMWSLAQRQNRPCRRTPSLICRGLRTPQDSSVTPSSAVQGGGCGTGPAREPHRGAVGGKVRGWDWMLLQLTGGSRLPPEVTVHLHDLGLVSGGLWRGSGLWLWEWRKGRAERLGKEQVPRPGALGGKRLTG